VRSGSLRRVIAMTLACSGAGALLVASSACAAEWLVSPSARVATDYTDNPRLLEKGGTSSTGTVGETSATLQRRAERFDLSLRPSVRFARYQGDESLDSDDQYLDTHFKYVNERSEWSGSVNLTRDTTLTSEIGSTGFVQANRRHESITVSAGPTFWLTERVNAGVQAYLLDSHYPDARNTGLVDYEYRALSLFSGFSATERSSFTLSMQGGELVVPDVGSRTRDASMRIAWSYQPYSLWTAQVSGGPAYVDAEFGHDSGVVFDLDLQREGEFWTIDSKVGRNLTPTGRGVLTQRDRALLSVSRRLTEYLSAGISAQWIRNQDLLQRPGIVFDEVRYGRLDLSMSWHFAEHWSMALTLGGVTQSYESRPATAENYRATLSMIWNGRQQTL
jgi:hypothetical protein